jgi:hypothetical protein
MEIRQMRPTKDLLAELREESTKHWSAAMVALNEEKQTIIVHPPN